MKSRATEIFPLAIALVLPPAGLLIGLFAMQENRDNGLRICAAALVGVVVWVLLLTI
jgi:hypothetical protein